MMTPKSLSPLLILSLLLPFLLVDISTAFGGVRLGGWKPIKDVTVPEVQEAAKFAVTEHNKAAKSGLVYQSVERGDEQIVSGVNYRLIITAKDGAATGEYEAVVWVKPWVHYKNLTSFRKI